MSLRIWRAASGRWTLTTTRSPPGSTAPCTWPMEAEASGSGSKLSKACSTVRPRSCRIDLGDHGEVERRDLVLQLDQLLDDVGRHDVRTSAEQLAELDEGRPQLVQHLPDVTAALRRAAGARACASAGRTGRGGAARRSSRSRGGTPPRTPLASARGCGCG